MLCHGYRQRHRGPVVIVTQAAGGAHRLHHDMPVLADFPCCDMPARPADSKYPPLQWQQRAAKVAVQRLAAHGSWLQVAMNQFTINRCMFGVFGTDEGRQQTVTEVRHTLALQPCHQHDLQQSCASLQHRQAVSCMWLGDQDHHSKLLAAHVVML